MIVKEVMVKKVVTVKKDDHLDKAQNLMVKNSIRHLPVMNGKELWGIITESDIRGAFLAQANAKTGKILELDPKQMKVRDYMTRSMLFFGPEKNIEDAALLIY